MSAKSGADFTVVTISRVIFVSAALLLYNVICEKNGVWIRQSSDCNHAIRWQSMWLWITMKIVMIAGVRRKVSASCPTSGTRQKHIQNLVSCSPEIIGELHQALFYLYLTFYIMCSCITSLHTSIHLMKQWAWTANVVRFIKENLNL